MAEPKPWPYVYRMRWVYEDGSTHTQRISEAEAEWQQRTYEPEDENKLVIERAPVGEWEVIYAP